MKEELKNQKVLGSWLAIFVLLKYFYFGYEKSVEPSTIIWLVGSVLQIIVGVLFIAIISRLLVSYSSFKGTTKKSSYIYIFGMFLLGLFCLTPLLLGPGPQYLSNPQLATLFNLCGYFFLYEGIRGMIGRRQSHF